MRVIVELRDHDGALVGIDTWGAVLNVGYSGAENALTVNGSDGVGIRTKWYGSGQYAAVVMLPAGSEDFSLWPADAKRQ
jgi:hypothetical protein